jgi:hypothetical protein
MPSSHRNQQMGITSKHYSNSRKLDALVNKVQTILITHVGAVNAAQALDDSVFGLRYA